MTKRLLIVSPTFHGYWRSIEAAFSALGYEASTFCYDHAPRAEKLYNKLRYELPSRFTGAEVHLSDELVTARVRAVVRERHPDIVLVVRGDCLTPDFWAELPSMCDAAAVWFYDELRRMRVDLATIPEDVGVATYSKGDAQELGGRAIYVPLAFDPDAPIRVKRSQPKVTFIGARFDKRERAMRALVDAGLPVRAYGRDWSPHVVDRLRTWRLTTPPIPGARDLALPDAYGVMQTSLATLNIHGDQDGFTMRTFEACGVGAVQMCDRDDVDEFYEPGGETLVYHDETELIELCRRAAENPNSLNGLRERARSRTYAEHTFVHRARLLEGLWR